MRPPRPSTARLVSPTTTRSAPFFWNGADVEPSSGSIGGLDGCRSHVARIAHASVGTGSLEATMNLRALSKWRDLGRHPYENTEWPAQRLSMKIALPNTDRRCSRRGCRFHGSG